MSRTLSLQTPAAWWLEGAGGVLLYQLQHAPNTIHQNLEGGKRQQGSAEVGAVRPPPRFLIHHAFTCLLTRNGERAADERKLRVRATLLSRSAFQEGGSAGAYTQSNGCTTRQVTGVQALSLLHSTGRRVCLRFVPSRRSGRAGPPGLPPSGGGAGARNEAGGRSDDSACVVWRFYSYASLRCFTAYTKMPASSSRNRIR